MNSEQVRKRMKASTLAFEPAPTPPPAPPQSNLPPIIHSNILPMRPRGSGRCERRCESRGEHRRWVLERSDGLVRLTYTRGRRGAKKPRYKTDHTKRHLRRCMWGKY
jgi:hypothetical protein